MMTTLADLRPFVATFTKRSKRLLAILLILFSMVGKGQSPSGPQTPEALGERVFSALQTQDLQGYTSLFITLEEFQLMSRQLDASDSVKARYLQVGPKFFDYVHQQAEANFSDLQAAAEKHNLNWETAQLVRVIVTAGEPIEGTTDRKDLRLLCQSEGRPFSLFLTDSAFGSRWNVYERIKIQIE